MVDYLQHHAGLIVAQTIAETVSHTQGYICKDDLVSGQKEDEKLCCGNYGLQ